MKTAELNVTLIGHTVFNPPFNERGNPIFDPDYVNLLPADDGVADGQALIEFAGRACYQSFDKPNPKTRANKDYLAHIIESGHFSVLEHANATFYLTGVTRTLTHELIRHRHLSYSELSQRFVNMDKAALVYPPAIQEIITGVKKDLNTPGAKTDSYEFTRAASIESDITRLDLEIRRVYEKLVTALMDIGLERKQAREAARAVMQNMTETRMVVTGNYRAWIEVIKKRNSPHADAEIQLFAQAVLGHLTTLAPNVFGPDAEKLWSAS